MATDSAPGPVTQQERIPSIDIVRGFALLGILVMNITWFGSPEGIDSNPYALGPTTKASVAVWITRVIFFDGKLRALFSMLFGAGVILLTERAEKRGAASEAADIFTRRNMWLVLFGLVHAYFLWTGDVLYYYGVTALLFLYPCRKLSARTLITTGLLVFALSAGVRVYRLETRIHLAQRVSLAKLEEQSGKSLSPKQIEEQDAWNDIAAEYHPDRKTIEAQIAQMRGGYASVFARSVAYNPQAQGLRYYEFLFCDALGMMLIGMGLFRAGFLTGKLTTGTYGIIALLGYGIGVPLGIVMVRETMRSGFDVLTAYKWLYLPFDPQRLCIALANAALLLILIKVGAFQWLTKRLAAVGQTALSNYIGTSILCCLFFNGYGFGFFGRLQLSQLMLVVVAVWCVNLIVSPIWLKYFRFGPLEWVWRSLTYWKREPMLR
jgi:uncharacterized protein